MQEIVQELDYPEVAVEEVKSKIKASILGTPMN
jgi:hypothetical protein